jgi:oligosaccharyltransferase complex subunit delta (ribophorin II)
MDKFAAKTKVTLKKASRLSDNEVVAENLELASSSANNVLYEFPKDKGMQWATAGLYSLQFAVKPLSEDARFSTLDRAVVQIRVAIDVRPQTFEAFVSESAKGTGVQEHDIQRATSPNQISGITAGVGKFVHMKLVLTGAASVHPSQVFAQLTSPKGKQGIFVFTSNDNSNTYTSKLDLGSAEVADELGGSGKYTVDVIVGDALLLKAASWRVGTFDVTLPATGSSAAADPFTPKPEISHLFRVDEARPTRVIALLFTAIVLLPLVVLLMNLLTSSFSWSFTSNSDFLSFVTFHGSLFAILALYIWYWISLNIFQAIVFAAPLTLAAIVAGRGLLKSLHTKSSKSKGD